MPLELAFICWQIPKVHPGEKKSNKLIYYSILKLPEPKFIQTLSTLPECTHEELFQTKGLCYLSCLVEHGHGLRHQTRAADPPGKSPVGRGACGSLSAAACKVYLGLFGFVWVYLGLFVFICPTNTFCVQAHLSHQNRGIEDHDGSSPSTATNIAGKQLPGPAEVFFICCLCFAEFWQTFICPPAGLCCSEGWMAP